ncbi:hypothetical protein PX554_19440 [Sphingomonas sp. H39-1-10]|uniref:hypothetical protein n=1 Tax=Sphingomonas pollutisoli TaxID=3030829 RepID=UPI0023B8D2EA|nr:hypothetical protein [Sphingomonas pollutisoli]MDF0490304.1 hypothetical protein [Sphingomonas pollutisoli]
MTIASVSISANQRTGLIVIRLPPQMNLETFRRIEETIFNHVRALRALGRQPSLLVDTSLQGAQSKEVVEAIQSFTNSRLGRELRIAVIVQSQLRRLQAKRVHSEETHRIFETEGDALHWLNLT